MQIIFAKRSEITIKTLKKVKNYAKDMKIKKKYKE